MGTSKKENNGYGLGSRYLDKGCLLVVLDVGVDAIAGLTAFLGALFSALYYLAARLLERRFPQAGILLGKAKLVEYSAPKEVK